MSFPLSAPNLQIWNNAAFDDSGITGDSGDLGGGNGWLPLQPISIDPSKENRSPTSKITPSIIKPLTKSSKKTVKQVAGAIAGDGDIEAEIEKVEKEIRLLTARLEVLRIRKAQKDLRIASSRCGRIVPAKFMEQKPSPASKKVESPASKKVESPAIARRQRRGFSLGPLEIHGSVANSCFNRLEGIKEEETQTATPPNKVADRAADPFDGGSSRRRGLSLGPSEIAAGIPSRLLSKLEGIKEERGRKEKRQSSSVSARTRKPALNNIAEWRKGIVTVGAKKSAKREDASSASFKPKALFHEEQNPAPRKKTMKNSKVRIVASRYSLATARCQEPESKRRKWSLPEPGKENSDELESFGESNESEPSIVGNSSPPSMLKIAEMLPKIRTMRSMAESPRDSGCAKRVAQLLGRKSHFAREDDSEENNLNFE